MSRAQAAAYDAAMLRAASGAMLRPTLQLDASVRHAITLLAAERPSPPARGALTSKAPPRDVTEAIMSAARATGVSPAYLWKTAARESGLDPFAASAASTARGLYQFVEQTWPATLWRHGPRHGVGLSSRIERTGRIYTVDRIHRAHVLHLRHDPWVSARMAGELANDNRRALERSLGRRVSDGDLYVAHFLGPADALRLIAAASQRPHVAAAQLLPAAARSNIGVFHRDGRALACRELLERLHHG